MLLEATWQHTSIRLTCYRALIIHFDLYFLNLHQTEGTYQETTYTIFHSFTLKMGRKLTCLLIEYRDQLAEIISIMTYPVRSEYSEMTWGALPCVLHDFVGSNLKRQQWKDMISIYVHSCVRLTYTYTLHYRIVKYVFSKGAYIKQIEPPITSYTWRRNQLFPMGKLLLRHHFERGV